MAFTLHFVGPLSQTRYTVEQLEVTTTYGDLTIHDNHAPMIATLADNNEIQYTYADGSQERTQLAGGILHVERDQTTIIVDG